ncbi:hypothetical protein VTN02DRAFT_1300 [Thermoascus thermophilus]
MDSAVAIRHDENRLQGCQKLHGALCSRDPDRAVLEDGGRVVVVVGLPDKAAGSKKQKHLGSENESNSGPGRDEQTR